MQQRTWDHFEKTNEADFAYSIPDLGRFRVNGYRQRSTIGMVFRLVRSHARSFGELNLPEAVRRLADEQRGLDPRHRADRVRQDDDARRHDRPHQPDP